MHYTEKLFVDGGSQAVHLPRDCRFECSEVYIRKDPLSGDVIISEKPVSWDGFFELLAKVEVPDDFLMEREDCLPQEIDSLV